MKPHTKDIIRKIIRDKNLITSTKQNVKHFGTRLPFWLRVHVYTLWFFLDIKIISMVSVGIAQKPPDCRLTGWALLCWCEALTWALLWAELPCENLWEEQGRHCSSPLTAPSWEANSPPLLCVCMCVFPLYFILHYEALYIYNMCIYLPKGKDIFLLNNVNKIRLHIHIEGSVWFHLNIDEIYTDLLWHQIFLRKFFTTQWLRWHQI